MITYRTLDNALFFCGFVKHLDPFIYCEEDQDCLSIIVNYYNITGCAYIDASFEKEAFSVFAYRYNDLGEKIEYLKDLEVANRKDIAELIKWAGL